VQRRGAVPLVIGRVCVRAGLLALCRVLCLGAAFLVSGCGGSHGFQPTKGDLNSEENLKHDCADPQWKEQNLGLWYSLCRQPLRW